MRPESSGCTPNETGADTDFNSSITASPWSTYTVIAGCVYIFARSSGRRSLYSAPRRRKARFQANVKELPSTHRPSPLAWRLSERSYQQDSRGKRHLGGDRTSWSPTSPISNLSRVGAHNDRCQICSSTKDRMGAPHSPPNHHRPLPSRR